MGNKTTVVDMGIGGAATVALFWILGFFYPEFMETQPAGAEAAITVLFVGLFSFLKESKE